MAKINLLPWREAFRAEKKKEFLTVLVGVLIATAAVAFVWDRMANGQISAQEDRNRILQAEIDNLDGKVKEIKELKEQRQALLDRIKVIQELQGNRPEIVKAFDEFVRAIPDGIFLTFMKVVGDQVSLKGFAESNNRVSVLMRRLDGSPKFADPNLTKVKANSKLGEDGSEFEMRVKVVISDVEEDGDTNNKNQPAAKEGS